MTLARPPGCPHCGVTLTTDGACPNCGRSPSRRWFAGFLRRRATTAVALVVLLIMLGTFLLFFGMTTSTGGTDFDSILGRTINAAEFRALEVGMSEKDVKDEVGDGEDALEYSYEGIATEPMDARCVYYRHGGGSVQLCFRDGKLSSKRAY